MIYQKKAKLWLHTNKIAHAPSFINPALKDNIKDLDLEKKLLFLLHFR